MPDNERLETLRDLKESIVETNRQLETMPVAARSQKIEKHKKELEEKLARLERAVETFSKEQVYVAI